MYGELARILNESENIVFFGGAGVSTESGIPDFRSVDGLYHQQYSHPPETILSHEFYEEEPEEFFRFYRSKMLFPDAQPNAAHRALAELERRGSLKAVVTQNIDGLHQKAGSRNVLELHGSVHKNRCERCGRFYPLEYMLHGEGVPHCACGGRVKPQVVLYGEGLDDSVVRRAVAAISAAEVLIIGGTSLAVYPAAGMIDYYRGHRLVLINKSPTPADGSADYLVQGPIGQVLGAAVGGSPPAPGEA